MSWIRDRQPISSLKDLRVHKSGGDETSHTSHKPIHLPVSDKSLAIRARFEPVLLGGRRRCYSLNIGSAWCMCVFTVVTYSKWAMFMLFCLHI